ncbi:MAG: UbiA family prenyltransferase [Verrucomicrobia bacterium]|nr:UbiA family prenyltransferase [Verrucomicrobiota bacterium]
MPATVSTEPATLVPLCVDLDGTLIKTDLLGESMTRLLKRNPLHLFVLPFWWLKGRAFLKREIAARVELDVTTLPYHQPLIDFLREEHRRGRPIFLATASDRKLVQPVADHVGLFTAVLASDGETNLRGTQKLRAMEERFGMRGFDYAGNSSVDLPVWQHARQAIVVNARESVTARARQIATVSHVFNEAQMPIQSLLKTLRPHQWVKNLIIFVPLLTSHQLNNTTLLAHAVRAFVAFSLCASSVYVLNDLLDLDADRHHPTKKLRPFAAGDLSLPTGFALVLILLVGSFGLAWLLPKTFALVLALYFVLTTSYSWRLKQFVLLDVFFLAGLYTMRLIGGHEATEIAYSFWLLAFSMFIFLSLALVKRYLELLALRHENRHDVKGRGYTANDLEMVATLGTASGYLSALVLALYVNSEQVVKLYAHPILLLLACPLLLYWISRVWLIAHRGQMHDDPIVFALKDSTSYVIGGLTLLVLWLATGH